MFESFFTKKIKVGSVKEAEEIFTKLNNPFSVETMNDLKNYYVGYITYRENDTFYMCDILIAKNDLEKNQSIAVNKINTKNYLDFDKGLSKAIVSDAFIRTIGVTDEYFEEFSNRLKEIRLLDLLSHKDSKVIHIVSAPVELSEIQKKSLELKKDIETLLINIKFTKAIKENLTNKRKGKGAKYIDGSFSDMFNEFLEDNKLNHNEITDIDIKYIEAYFIGTLLDKIKKNEI